VSDEVCVECGKAPVHGSMMITREVTVTVHTPLNAKPKTKAIEEKVCSVCYRDALETRRERETRGLG